MLIVHYVKANADSGRLANVFDLFNEKPVPKVLLARVFHIFRLKHVLIIILEHVYHQLASERCSNNHIRTSF